MSTRSTIGIRLDGGGVMAIYCHWDGYPSHQKPLLKHYNTHEKVAALIALGSLSLLGEEVGEKHLFDPIINKGDDVTKKCDEYHQKFGKMCKAYHRDRGEKWDDVKPQTFKSVKAWKESMAESWCEHSYLFNPKTGKWTHSVL